MSLTPYTQKRNYQFRGPQSSEDYNLRLEETAKDLAVLYNQLAQLHALADENGSYVAKTIQTIVAKMMDVDARLAVLEQGSDILAIRSDAQLVTADFSETSWQANPATICDYSSKYNFLTLPHIHSSSVSKIKFKNSDGSYATSSNLEMLVVPDNTSDDNNSAVIETSQPVYAVVNEAGRIWQRNVISATANNDAVMTLYVRIPNDLSITDYTNAILFDVYPMFGVDVLDVSYSTDVGVVLSSAATWTPLNSEIAYYNVDEAIGYLAPGAWAGDEVEDAGPLAFYFPQKKITAIRITLRRDETYDDGGDFVYSYGLSNLDIRYNKFADVGQAIILYEAPSGQTISSIDSVTPYIWNVPEYLVDSVFKYEVIWETSFESGEYTSTPVPLSQRVWLKVALNKGPNGDQIPVLSNLIVRYS